MTEGDTHDLERMAALLALTIPEACVPGIVANLDLLKNHARVLEAYLEQGEKAS